MKWHFNFFRFAVMCAAFVALAGFMACSDDDSESGSELVLSASTSSLAGGGSVGKSGCPMFRWNTCTPLCLAASARGASFLIGDAGISVPRIDIAGMSKFLQFDK